MVPRTLGGAFPPDVVREEAADSTPTLEEENVDDSPFDIVNFEAVSSSSLLAHDVPFLLSVWTMLQDDRIIKEFEDYLESENLERKGSRSTKQLRRNTELVVRVYLNSCLVEAIEPCQGTKSNCQFQLTAPNGLAPGPRNGFIQVWSLAGGVKGPRVCRFAFSVNVAASLAYLEYMTQDTPNTGEANGISLKARSQHRRGQRDQFEGSVPTQERPTGSV
jgi:hypothetical protein